MSSKLDKIILDAQSSAAINPDPLAHLKARDKAQEQIKSLFLEIAESCNNTWGNGRATPGEHINTEELRKKIKEL